MDTVEATNPTIERWLIRFDDRMRQHVDFCRQYEAAFNHGAPGHLDFQTISRLATCLEEATGLIESVEHALQTNTGAARELLAAYAHDEAWSGWMRYVFDKSTFNADGSVTIPTWAVERWGRQIATPYRELPEDEKESDRKEADRMLTIVREVIRAER